MWNFKLRRIYKNEAKKYRLAIITALNKWFDASASIVLKRKFCFYLHAKVDILILLLKFKNEKSAFAWCGFKR